MTDASAINRTFPLPSLFPSKRQLAERRFKVACFAHDDSTPSMVVTYHRDYGWRAHCFGCGWDGSTIDVVMALDRCTFGEAMDKLRGGREIQRPMERQVKVKVVVLVCDACGLSRVEGMDRTWERYGKAYASTAACEAKANAERYGWTVARGVAVCPGCLGEPVIRRRVTPEWMTELAVLMYDIETETLTQNERE